MTSYEYMAHPTARSSKYFFFNGHYHPISVIPKGTDEFVSKEESLYFMQDLKAEWKKPETQKNFHAELAQMRKVEKLLVDGSEASRKILREDLKKSQGSAIGRLLEAQIRDSMEAAAQRRLR